jgi:uncharacterized secreted protein with C-terminal beta-propeller domain
MREKRVKKKTVFFSLLVLSVFLFGCISIPPDGRMHAKEIPRFSSCSAIGEAFKEGMQRGYGGMMYYETMVAGPMAKKSTEFGTEYSATNVQVEGVDEADIVKTDGKYIYSLSKRRLAITDAFPAENARVLSLVELKDFNPQEMFIDKDKVVVFGYFYERVYPEEQEKIESNEDIKESIVPPYYSKTFTEVKVFDVSDKENPKEIKAYDFEGQYVSSRKIGSNVYFVVRSFPEPIYRIMEKEMMEHHGESGEESEKNLTEKEVIPMFRETRNGVKGDLKPVARCGEVGYLEPIRAEAFITLASIDLSNLDKEIEKETVVGSGQNVYASQKNLYLAESTYSYGPMPLMAVGVPEQESKEKTVIHKFSLNKGKIAYLGSMEAPGRILNQFSMDEFEGHFRIATTVGRVSRMGGSSSNNIYVFGEDLKLKGKLEDLAPGERIYSARFMGKKAYLVTFKKVDPLFVIDLSNPEKPKVLGKLKIPGYSDYLHPIDETHLIGLGKETVEAEEGDFAWYQGIKLAVFDVSDVENPIELHKTVIGDRGTDSYALHDHKAFLFDKEKELLVIPVLLAELSEAQKKSGYKPNTYGEFTFQGAYVYRLTLENGFELKGRITHVSDEDSFKKSGHYYYGGGNAVKRALYIENILYTISDNKILANNLSDLLLIKELVLE